tara:strand:+ start:3519 stop:4550 length:1032 start_codon:yes stop_codon:yes gene_type:complete
MDNPIIDNGVFNLKSFSIFLLSILKKYIKIFVIIIIVYIAYFLIKSPVYSSSISFYSNYSSISNGTSIEFLQSLSGASDNDELGFSISDFIDSDRFLSQLINEKYIINENKISLVEHIAIRSGNLFSINPLVFFENISLRLSLAPNLSAQQKAEFFSKKYIKDNLSYFEDRKTHLHRISFKGKNLELTEQITENIFKSILQYSNKVTNDKATEKRMFIQGRLDDIGKELELAENEKLNFLEKNKIISSPSLILQENRIEKNIRLYQSLFISLSDQLELAKIDEKDVTSPIVILDEPIMSYFRVGRSLLTNILIIFSILASLFLVFEGFKNRKDLFIYNKGLTI